MAYITLWDYVPSVSITTTLSVSLNYSDAAQGDIDSVTIGWGYSGTDSTIYSTP